MTARITSPWCSPALHGGGVDCCNLRAVGAKGGEGERERKVTGQWERDRWCERKWRAVGREHRGETCEKGGGGGVLVVGA